MKRWFNFNKRHSEYVMVLETNKQIWEEYFKQSNFSNLLQSWCYGDAKAKFEGWVVRRGIIKKNNVPVALCQWLEKNILKVVRIIRINRGPIWLFNHINSEERFLLYSFLRHCFSVWKWNLLFIAPALENTTESNITLRSLGYKKRHKLIPWKSSLINLAKTESELRASLQSRLRNYLKRSENLNFIFECSYEKSCFLHLLERYKNLQKEKNFNGIPSEFIELLYDFSSKNGHALITRIKNSDGELMAEKFLVIHGNQCTPLIAWTSDEGTKCHAMHFLIWKIILDLKSRGVLYFDVGGYNENERPSICQFKKGFSGEEYCLVGEYRGF